MQYIICHYSEIALKGNNRRFFEEQLIENIKRVLNKEFYFFIKRISGRIIIKLDQQGLKEKQQIEKRLKFVFGISSFSFCYEVNQDLQSINKGALSALKEQSFKKFKVKTQRSNKNFNLSSQQVNEKVGEHILNNFKNIEVSLKNPDIIIFIEIVEKYAFVYIEKIKSHGGLPTGISGKAISLLSGGIDSPVASFLAMTRGIKVIFVHFHSYPETSQNSLDKVKEIVEKLSLYQGQSKLYLVPISKVQREIVLKIPEKLRIIFYRRIMLTIAKEIALKEKAKVLFTGDSIGQVASQTIENISAIEYNLNMPVIRPLACQDKDSIIKKSKEIGVFDISILPHDDCCSRFLPRRPETKAKIEEVLQQEKKIDINETAKQLIKETDIITINNSKYE